MRTFKLKKDLPGIETGTIIIDKMYITTNDNKTVVVDEEYMSNNQEWFELVNDSKFKIGDKYWCLDELNQIHIAYFQNNEYDKARLKLGNAFKTEEEAELHKLRLEAMADVYVPDNRENYFYYNFRSKKVYASINCDELYDIALMTIGNCFPTTEQGELDCEAWGEKYQEAFLAKLKKD